MGGNLGKVPDCRALGSVEDRWHRLSGNGGAELALFSLLADKRVCGRHTGGLVTNPFQNHVLGVSRGHLCGRKESRGLITLTAGPSLFFAGAFPTHADTRTPILCRCPASVCTFTAH